MPKALIGSIALLLILIACNKDKFQTKPSVKIKSFTSDIVGPGGALTFTLEFTDKEGDLGEGEVTYILNRQNTRPLGSSGVDQPDTVRNTLPEFPDHRKGEITVNISYDFLDEDPNYNDSFLVKFAVADIKGNKSDTAISTLIIAKQN